MKAGCLTAIVLLLSLQVLAQNCPYGGTRVATSYGSYCTPGNPPPSTPIVRPQTVTTSPPPKPSAFAVLPDRLPTVNELEVMVKNVHPTLAKCRAVDSQFPADDELTLSWDQLSAVNLTAYACMKLGGLSATYGYRLKAEVDFVTAFRTFQELEKAHQAQDSADLNAKIEQVETAVHGLINRYQDTVDRYNSLIGQYNQVIAYTDQLHASNRELLRIAQDAVNLASYYHYSAPVDSPPPEAPRTIYVQQAPLSCTTHTIPTMFNATPAWTYTDCH